MATRHRLRIRLSKGPVELQIGSNHLRSLGGRLRQMDLGTHPVLLTNKTIWKAQGAQLQRCLTGSGWKPQRITVADSERSKSLAVLNRLLGSLARMDGPGRRLFLILAGGGVVGDLGGVAAGLYRRGIPYVQLPTTLLAQADSSIGGKTAVDLPEGKNLVGLIVQPKLIFMELSFLKSLSDRQFRSGLAEIAKCGVIRDADLFRALERQTVTQLRRQEGRLAWALYRAVRVKAQVVEQDEFETKGIRTILNFGHTLGHALETASHYRRRYTHGEAVAVGMGVATEISERLKLISSGNAERIRSLICHLELPTTIGGVQLTPLLRAMSHDKKWFKGKNRWVLPTGIGRCRVQENVPEQVIKQAIRSAWEG